MRKEEEAVSYNMNVDDTNNNNNYYICTDDYIDEDNDNNNNNNTKKSQAQAWGTWEELLLACAVKRHGFGDWDSVATEVRSRSSLSHLLASANNCRHKYGDLKRRFQEEERTVAAGETETAEEEKEERVGNNIPWLEQLRNLRVAELRREVERYDVSILSLQLKVKKLEEREEKLDLEDERKRERSENDGSESEHREKAVSAAEESDRENRSMNESNSTATVGEDERVGGDEPSQTRDDDSGDNNNPDPDPVNKDTAEEEEEGSVSRGSEASHSDELGESGTSERKWKRKRRKHGGSGEIRSGESKSQPLIGLLDLIRSHPRGSLFERRLRSQEAKDYKSKVKQHLDIQTIQRKLKQGSYDSSTLTFYRDLQLLFTNAIVFFPLSSVESMAAHELRAVVSEEMRKETGKFGPRLINREASAMNSGKADAETSDSSLSRQKSSAPLVVCKKRSSVSTKASYSSSIFSQKEETKEETLSEEKENIVTGVRSSRRVNKVVAAAAAISKNTKKGKGKSKQKQTESKTNSSNDNTSKQETGKTEKKTVSSDKKKSVADFLKRLKNSPQKESKDQNKSGGSGKKDSKTKPRELRSSSVGKKKAGVENTPVKRAPGRPQKKTTEAGATATASASGKRGRDTGSTGKDNKQPKKRIRR